MIYTRPMFHRVIKRHLAAVKKSSEARAARSHVFRRRCELLMAGASPFDP